MKTFTKVMLILSGVFAAIGVICIVIACSLGLTWGSFQNMVEDGKFKIDFGGNFDINFFGSGIHIGNGKEESGQSEIMEEVEKLDIEFGAGVLDIRYGDVEQIRIDYEYIVGFETSVKNGTLRVEGALGVGDNSNGALTITIPYGMEFEEVRLEIGASEAKVKDIVAEKVEIDVGVGQATVSNLTAKKIDVDTGVGQLVMELVGKETDYSYNVDCGIGSVTIGSKSYAGLGASNTVKNPDATCQVDIDCGVGEVKVTFTE